jgi:hypothetical protein
MVGKSLFHVVAALARLLPKIEIQEPAWMVVAEL